MIENENHFIVNEPRENWMISDLHIHSRFSQACSKNITIPNLVKWGKIKGIDLIGTGDFSHPVWLQEIKDNLKDNGKGFYIYEDKEKGESFNFVITGEISFIYTQEKGRRIHLVLLVPSIEIAEKINEYLDTLGRRDYDGRPIFGISCRDFVKKIFDISEDIEIIPAHIWTPWFGLFGSMSGFDSIKEAFQDKADKIHAIETGISSDPEMNWRIKELVDNNISIVSFSDSHSFWPHRLGREATIFRKTDSYKELIRQIRENDFIGTIEADPNYGKYHWDGHRACDFVSEPKKTRELGGICPKCGRVLTKGVEYRVEEIAENLSYNLENKPENAKPYFKILPLHELISFVVGVSMQSKKVWEIYNKLISDFGNEFRVLLDVSEDEIYNSIKNKALAEFIIKNRQGKVKVKPGYDGVYGEPVLDDIKEEDSKKREVSQESFSNKGNESLREKQKTLF